MPTPWGAPYPWEPGGAFNQGTPAAQPDPSKPIGSQTAPAAPAAAAAQTQISEATRATLKQLIDQYGMPIGQPTPTTYKNTITGAPTPDNSGNMLYTFPGGITAVVGPNGEQGAVTKPTTTTTGTTAAQVSQTQLGDPQNGVWEKLNDQGKQDTNGVWTQTVKPQSGAPKTNTPEEQAQIQANTTKALVDAGLSQAQAQALADKTPAEIQQALAAAGASQATAQKTLNDIAIANAKLGTDIAATQATTARDVAQTAQTQSATDIAAQKAGPEIADIQATTAGRQATTAATQQKIAQANAPNLQTNVGAGPYIYKQDPNTGALTTDINANWAPKSQADVAQRVGQLQQMAQAQRDALSAQVANGSLTPEKAASQFDSWWGSTVEPQKGMLQAAQQQAQLDQQQKLEEQQRANYATAQAAGQTAVTAAANQAQHLVGPGYGAAMQNLSNAWASAGQGKMTAPISGQTAASAFTTPAANMNDIYQQATAQALQHISPTAAAIANGPGATPTLLANPPDISAQLNRTQYDAFGNPTPSAPAAAAGGTAPPGPITSLGPNPPTPPAPPTWTQAAPNFGNPGFGYAPGPYQWGGPVPGLVGAVQ